MQYRSSGPPDYGPETAPGRLLGGEKWVHVVDMADSDTYRTGDPNRRALVDLGGARSTLVVPLRKEDTLLGMVAIYRQEVRPFSDRQIALVQNFADQAVIAMENARLLSELRERTDDLTESLEYQTATSEVLEVIGRSTSDIQPVLDTMLNAALRLCRTESGGIAIQQGEGFRYVATLGWDPEADKAFRSLDISAGRGTVAARVIAEGRIVQVADVASDPEFALPDMAERAQWRTALGVPLMREGRAIGVIAITRDRVDAFTERQIALVKTFADQAVIAMENARLLGELRESLDQQTATTEVLQVINSSPGELEPVFEAILEKAMQACHAAFGGLWIFDAGRYVAAALHKVPKAYADFLRSNTQVPGPGTGPYRFLRGERSVIQNIDLADEEVYPAGDPQRRALVDLGGARTALQVPLCKDDTVIGVVTIYRQEVRAFDERHITLLQSFAAQAVIAIQNARLLSELRASLEQQTATSDVLKTISRSSVDLEAVLETLVETVARLCRADQAFMVRRRDNLRRSAAVPAHPSRCAGQWKHRRPCNIGAANHPDRRRAGRSRIHV
jgi:GAF domain-containing protein